MEKNLRLNQTKTRVIDGEKMVVFLSRFTPIFHFVAAVVGGLLCRVLIGRPGSYPPGPAAGVV